MVLRFHGLCSRSRNKSHKDVIEAVIKVYKMFQSNHHDVDEFLRKSIHILRTTSVHFNLFQNQKKKGKKKNLLGTSRKGIA